MSQLAFLWDVWRGTRRAGRLVTAKPEVNASLGSATMRELAERQQ
jgi:hypothetical protein